jgi:hypothetical protein
MCLYEGPSNRLCTRLRIVRLWDFARLRLIRCRLRVGRDRAVLFPALQVLRRNALVLQELSACFRRLLTFNYLHEPNNTVFDRLAKCRPLLEPFGDVIPQPGSVPGIDMQNVALPEKRLINASQGAAREQLNLNLKGLMGVDFPRPSVPQSFRCALSPCVVKPSQNQRTHPVVAPNQPIFG